MSTIKANTLLAADGTQTTEPSIPALDQRMAKAWVNFSGTGTVAIRSSYNVSSITDGGIGIYTVNFATTMADANYVIQGSSGGYANNPSDGNLAAYPSSTTTAMIDIYTSAGSAYDSAYVGVTIFN
jgi:hypothetical protein